LPADSCASTAATTGTGSVPPDRDRTLGRARRGTNRAAGSQDVTAAAAEGKARRVTRLSPRMRLAIGTTVSALVVFALCVLAPLRQAGGDTVGGRLGGAVLRCGGGFDLSRLDWIRERTDEGKYLYWLQRDATGDVSSIFGPGPAVVGAMALLDFGEGDVIAD